MIGIFTEMWSENDVLLSGVFRISTWSPSLGLTSLHQCTQITLEGFHFKWMEIITKIDEIAPNIEPRLVPFLVFWPQLRAQNVTL